jgi:hypothetical protein
MFFLVKALEWKKIESFTWNNILVTCITQTRKDIWNIKLMIL